MQYMFVNGPAAGKVRRARGRMPKFINVPFLADDGFHFCMYKLDSCDGKMCYFKVKGDGNDDD